MSISKGEAEASDFGSIPFQVLLVEAEYLVAIDLQDLLTGWGYWVELASTGEAALQLVRIAPPDLALLSLPLRGTLNGIDLAQQLWDEHAVPSIYLADNLQAMRSQRQRRYRCPFLLKPIDEDELRLAIAATPRRLG